MLVLLTHTAMPLVEIERLSKRYGEFDAVRELSLAIGEGEIVALIGPNGAGKTTTIRMLMGVLAPSSGSARVAGHDCFASRAEVMRHVGYLPDEPVFYDYLRGSEVIDFVIDMRGLDRAEGRQRAADLCARLQLADALAEYAVNYSKGMKKKLGLVCALTHDPALILLDEPINGLDPIAVRQLRTLVDEAAGRGRAVFYSTHVLAEAERQCHRAAILMRGRLVAHGSLDELRAQAAGTRSLEDVFFALASREAGDAEDAERPGDGT